MATDTVILFRNAGIRSEKRKFKALESEFNKVRSKGIADAFDTKKAIERYDINQMQSNIEERRAQIASSRAMYAADLSHRLVLTSIFLVISVIAGICVVMLPELAKFAWFTVGGALGCALASFGSFVSRERYFEAISTWYYYLGEDEALLAQMTSNISAI